MVSKPSNPPIWPGKKAPVPFSPDHGFDEHKTSHYNAPYIFLAANDPKVMRAGLRVDIAPTILRRFGLDLSKIEPALDGHPLTEPAPTPPTLEGTQKARRK
jgi:hypothetical protein